MKYSRLFSLSADPFAMYHLVSESMELPISKGFTLICPVCAASFAFNRIEASEYYFQIICYYDIN